MKATDVGLSLVEAESVKSSLFAKWDPYLDERWLGSLDATPFLSRCRKNTVSWPELRSFLIQQFWYSRQFTRYLCALIANLPLDEDRQALTQNLFEEMGLGQVGAIPHSRVYRDMMEKFGIPLEGEKPLPETLTLIRLMHTSCRHVDPIVGLAALCLGAEAIVPHVYSQIVSGMKAVGINERQLTFFTIHIEGDDDHALTLKHIIDREIERNRLKLPLLRETAKKLIECRQRFFEAISRIHQHQEVRDAK